MTNPLLRTLISEMFKSYLNEAKDSNKTINPEHNSSVPHTNLGKNLIDVLGVDKKVRESWRSSDKLHAHNFPASREEHKKIRDHLHDIGWRVTARYREFDHEDSIGTIHHSSPDGKQSVSTRWNHRPVRPDEDDAQVTYFTKK